MGGSRRQLLQPLPLPSGEASSPDLAGPKDPLCGGHADQARGRSFTASRIALVLLACLSLPILALVSGARYRPSPAFLSGIYGGPALWKQQQQPPPPPVEGQEQAVKSFRTQSLAASSSGNSLAYGANHAYGDGIASNTRENVNGGREALSSGASLPSTPPGASSDAELPNGAMASPSSPSVSLDANLHNGVATAPPPNSAENKLPEALLLTNATAAGPPTSATAAGSVSEGADTLPSPGDVPDKLLGGLLAAGFDEASCLSRYQSASFRRRKSPYNPSPYLVENLRSYEALHERCGPYTAAYSKSLLLLKPGRAATTAAGAQCKYLVWRAENGLGNRMVSLASAFLYALLAERVLLIDRSKDLGGLFCEPFPKSTWLLPLDFPLKVSAAFNRDHPQSYGNILQNLNLSDAGVAAASPLALVYTHLSHDYGVNDRRFFCQPDQHLLEKVPWMVLRSDQYFAPGLFLVPTFRRRLDRMFPEKEAVFHHLGRYLFHPSNPVWGLITGYYEANLAGAGEFLGIQLRLHFRGSPPYELVVNQILNCTWTEKLLPDVRQRPAANRTSPRPSKAVLLTSLHSGFLGRLQDVYGRRRRGVAATGRGTVVRFHQPSQEGRQQTGKEAHDGKALAEMYLLSMAEELVTSVWSTFGYVAQGLGGVSPWILQGPVHTAVPKPACVRAASMEPCFHYPPNYDCATGDYLETRRVLPFARKCRDRKLGIKLVGRKRRT